MAGKLVSYRDDGTGRVRMVDLKELKADGLGLILSGNKTIPKVSSLTFAPSNIQVGEDL